MRARLASWYNDEEISRKADIEPGEPPKHLAGAADNHQLTTNLLELWNGPSVGRGENAAAHHYQASTDEHSVLLEAVRDRQPDAAEQAMRRHIGRSMENMLSHYAAE